MFSSAFVVLACLLAATPANAQADDLINAADKGDLPCIKALLAAKADVNAKRDDGVTALLSDSENGNRDVACTARSCDASTLKTIEVQ